MTQEDAFAHAGAALKEARLAKGLSQEKLGFEAGLDQTKYSLVERVGPHKVSWAKLVAIAQALDCVVEINFIKSGK